MTTFKAAISNTFLWNPELGTGQAWKPGKRNGSTNENCATIGRMCSDARVWNSRGKMAGVASRWLKKHLF